MSSIIFGAALIVVTTISYWYFLPRNGQVHPFVQNSGIGSMITIVIMAALTFGVVILCEGLFG